MSLFLPNIPQPTDNLDFSQGQLLSNNQGLDTVFGIDHVKFSDATSSKGFHNYIHTVQQSAHPTTTATIPQIYAMQDSTNAGVIDYSRGWQIATGAPSAPTPLTNLQSPATALTIASPGGTLNVLDFTGLARAFATLYISGTFSAGIGLVVASADVYWDGTKLLVDNYSGNEAGALAASVSANILQIRSASGGLTNVFWTLRLHRTT